MLKIRKIGQCLTQQNEKELQKCFQKEADLLCKKFGLAKITVKIHDGGEKQVQTSFFQMSFNSNSTFALYSENIALKKCGGCCFYQEKELFINDRFLWDPLYLNLQLSLCYEVRTVIYVFLHEFAHFLDILNGRESWHDAQFRRVCNRLLKPYGVKDLKGQVKYKKVCLYSYN